MKCHQGQGSGPSQGPGLVPAEGRGQELIPAPGSVPASGPGQGPVPGPGPSIDLSLLPPRPIDREAANKMRNRRATLRKQRLRVEERIEQIMNLNADTNTSPTVDINATANGADANATSTPSPTSNHNHSTTDIANSDLNMASELDIDENTQLTEVIDVNHSGGSNTAILESPPPPLLPQVLPQLLPPRMLTPTTLT